MRPCAIALAGALALLAAPAPAAASTACHPVFADAAGAPANACAGAARVRIAAAGDVLLHSNLQRRGYAAGFATLWDAARPFMAAADIGYANLETPTAAGRAWAGPVADPGPVFDGRAYTSYPLFNAHPVVLDALAALGVDVVSTANNHALDRGPEGAAATLAALAARGIAATGTIAPGAPRRFVAYTASQLGRIAWVACSFSANGLPDPHRQVLMCFGDRDELLAVVAAESRRPGTAAVIVTPHWGVEYSHSPGPDQRALGAALAAAGAAAVIATHPHVVQPWEWAAGRAGRRVPVFHSTGNFVSGQAGLDRQTAILAWLELCRSAAAPAEGPPGPAPLAVARAGWVPLYMARTATGPALVIPEPGAGGAAGLARDLLARLLPEGDLRARVDCTRPLPPAVALQ
ncbi:MAG: CapA family protein [Rhodobacteraceae bacterium]|nr:CapA family protein [Paracoccaceae bacterium]